MQAHLYDLRSEIAVDLGISPDAAEAVADSIAADWRSAELDTRTMALLEFAEKLTRSPAAMTADDIAGLRAVGWGERAVHDAVQVCAYFNYINRVAESLGVEMEDWIDPAGRALD